MNKLFICMLCVGFFVSSKSYYGSTTAPVIIAGGIVKSKHIDESQKKYKRKDCPICKGKGWYLSGDSIKKVVCGYCEPEESQTISQSKEDPDCKTKIIRR